MKCELRRCGVLIVGAGPAGLAAAAALVKSGYREPVILIERGRRRQQRICPVDHGRRCSSCGGVCNVLSGFGGCIHYGDGVKLSELPAGRRLAEVLGAEAASARMSEAIHLINSSLEEEVPFYHPGPQPFAQPGVVYKPYPVATLNAPQVRRLLDGLWDRLSASPNLQLELGAEVTTLERNASGRYEAEVHRPQKPPERIEADQVIVAVGRAGLFWWRKTVRELGLAYTPPTPSVGVRFEMNYRRLEPGAAIHPDYKVTLHTDAGKFKSFCYCAGTGGGRIKCTDYGEFRLLDGHVRSRDDGPTDEHSPGNFALLHQLRDLTPGEDPVEQMLARFVQPYRAMRNDRPGSPVAQLFGDFRQRRQRTPSWTEMAASLAHRPSIQDLAPARIDSLFNDSVHGAFCSAAERFSEMLGATEAGHSSLDDALVIALELEGLWDVLKVDLHLETNRPGLFATGDALGTAQGILQAMATGMAAARRIVERESRPSIPQHARDRLVYDHYWTVGTHYDSSVTFVRMMDDLLGQNGHQPAVADLGCGLGRHAVHAASRGAHVVAVDHSSRAIERLRDLARGLPIEILEGDFVSWAQSFPRGTLDGLVCFDAIHHIAPEKSVVVSALRNMARLVRPGGLILITLLTGIDYGLKPPEGRLLVSPEEGGALLESVFAPHSLLVDKLTPVEFNQTLNLEPESGQLVTTHYRATRLLRLYRISA
jgi:uncharacterized FAD-dependent dehydrogenase/SAM-dependent methyltransferase